MNPNDYVKYSFLDQVGKYVAELGITDIGQLDNPKYNSVFERAVERIKTSVNNKPYTPKYDSPNTEILSFLASVTLLSLSNNMRLVKKFALYESKGIEISLKQDMKKDSVIANDIINSFFGNKMERRGVKYVVHVADYLKHSINFNEEEWKLVNQEVDKGYVHLDKNKLIRLLRTEISEYLTNKIKKIKIPNPPKMFVEYTSQISTLLEPSEFKMSKEYPPCIKHAINVLNRGDNLPHNGRLMLATYMFARGMEVEDILEFYRTAPDFNEKVTLYQLEQLSGEVGSGTKYKCPSCEKLKSQGLCFRTEECSKIINPIQFKSLVKNK